MAAGAEHCQICGRRLPAGELLPASTVRPVLLELAGIEPSAWDPAGAVCRDDVRRLRVGYVRGVLERGRGELSELEEQGLASVREHEVRQQRRHLRPALRMARAAVRTVLPQLLAATATPSVRPKSARSSPGPSVSSPTATTRGRCPTRSRSTRCPSIWISACRSPSSARRRGST